jgi:hypothetical protein
VSHFSQIKTQFKNPESLLRALKLLGFTELSEAQVCRGFFGDEVAVDFAVHAGKNYDLGFVKDANGNYQCVGDWEILPKIIKQDQESFGNQLKRTYAKCVIEDYLSTSHMQYEYVQNEDQSFEFVISEGV